MVHKPLMALRRHLFMARRLRKPMGRKSHLLGVTARMSLKQVLLWLHRSSTISSSSRMAVIPHTTMAARMGLPSRRHTSRLWADLLPSLRTLQHMLQRPQQEARLQRRRTPFRRAGRLRTMYLQRSQCPHQGRLRTPLIRMEPPAWALATVAAPSATRTKVVMAARDMQAWEVLVPMAGP